MVNNVVCHEIFGYFDSDDDVPPFTHPITKIAGASMGPVRPCK